MADDFLPTGDDSVAAPVKTFRFTLRAADVQLYRICDDFSGLLIFPMLVFSPWAFGTTQPWAVWVMNFAGYALGILLLAKLFIRQAKGYPAPRWGNFSARSGTNARHVHPFARRLVRWLAGLTLAVLAFCFISALNARSTYNPDLHLFEYHRCLGWLPNSLDSHRSWFVFWTYLGLAASFWSVRDWLLGLTPAEERAARLATDTDDKKSSALSLPRRWRVLLWLLCFNGAVLGAEAIAQRALGSDKLLFMVQPQVNPEGETQFGPYAYRSNAAQYFNLLWPVCLGFWWTLQRAAPRRKVHHLLLVCAAVMAACPVISSSRAGALVAAGMFVLAMIYLLVASLQSSNGKKTALLLGLFVLAATALGWYFGWETLSPRLEEFGVGLTNREAIYDSARPMAADYPWFGTGPGTFAPVFQLYRISNDTYWPEQLHNDWLETRITFGWVGLALILAALACVFLHRFARDGIRGARRFIFLAWLALAGCLVEARFDFPFQIHSVIFLFLIICAMLFCLGQRSRQP